MPEADGIWQLPNLNPTGEAPTWHFVPIYLSPSRNEDGTCEKALLWRQDVRSQRIPRPWARTSHAQIPFENTRGRESTREETLIALDSVRGASARARRHQA